MSLEIKRTVSQETHQPAHTAPCSVSIPGVGPRCSSPSQICTCQHEQETTCQHEQEAPTRPLVCSPPVTPPTRKEGTVTGLTLRASSRSLSGAQSAMIATARSQSWWNGAGRFSRGSTMPSAFVLRFFLGTCEAVEDKVGLAVVAAAAAGFFCGKLSYDPCELTSTTNLLTLKVPFSWLL